MQFVDFINIPDKEIIKKVFDIIFKVYTFAVLLEKRLILIFLDK